MTQETIDRIRKFSKDRDWDQFHTPANLAKSIVIEAGELLECYQWQDEADLEHVRQELADVIVYCRNMLDALGLDEDEIVNAKMDQNEKKYPIDKAYGSNVSVNSDCVPSSQPCKSPERSAEALRQPSLPPWPPSSVPQ